MFGHSKFVVLASLVIGSVGLVLPGAAFARGGGGGGGGGHGGLGGGGFGGGGFGRGGFSGGMSGFRSGGFNGGSFYRGSSANFGSARGMSGNAFSSFRGTARVGTHVPAAPTTGRWNHSGHFNHGGRFNHFNHFRNRFFFGGFWGFDWPSWYGDYPWWYADIADESYWNPYYGDAYLYGGYDYAGPIQQSDQGEQDNASFTAARQDFYAGSYTPALRDIDQATRDTPGNPDVHAFRALIYFAMGDYDRAAAVAHTVLEAGPGWDWAILESLYPSVDVYTKQLRALEHSIGEHPNNAATRFLLAYQYLMLGHFAAASHQLERVVVLEPRDKLAAAILESLKHGPTSPTSPANAQSGAAPAKPGPPGPPIDPKQLIGAWKSMPVPGITIEATLEPNGHFVWTATQDGQTQTFAGTYTVKDDNLVFARPDGNKMDGIVTLKGTNGFQFRLKNSPPQDSGLQFSK
jgi:hypothetical protein